MHSDSEYSAKRRFIYRATRRDSARCTRTRQFVVRKTWKRRVPRIICMPRGKFPVLQITVEIPGLVTEFLIADSPARDTNAIQIQAGRLMRLESQSRRSVTDNSPIEMQIRNRRDSEESRFLVDRSPNVTPAHYVGS